MKSEAPLSVKILGSNGLDFAHSKFDNLTERSVYHSPTRFSRVEATTDPPNLLAFSFKIPPIAVVLTTLKLRTVQIRMIETRSSSRTITVAPPLQLCFELGYHDWTEFPSRGPAKLLLQDLKDFVKNRPFSDSAESLIAAYLAAKPAGLKHKPFKNARQLELLSWPRDRLMLVPTKRL